MDIHEQIDSLQSVLNAQRQYYSRHGNWLIAIGILWLLAFGLDVFLAWRGDNSWLQILPWIVLTAAVLFIKREARARRVGQAVLWHNRVIGGIWLMAMTGMWATPLIASTGRLPNHVVLPLLDWWTAVPMIASGLLFRSAWFSAAGVLWFATGIASFFLPPEGQIIAYPSMIVIGFLLPAVHLTFKEQGTRASSAA